ncbi:hypothetical protein J6590_085739 [Homalodisca vitripennis]|nr:hypothetical protein J6590_085739 [Homalodisca vitripennis]
MVQRAIPPVINGYLTTLTTSSSITSVQHGQQRMVQRAIPPVINGYLTTLTTSSSITSVQHGQQRMVQRAIPPVINACDPSRYKWLPRHTHYLLIHHVRTTRTTAHGSACDPSRYKWLPHHTHYLSSITSEQHGQQRMVQRAIPPVINGYLATITTSSSITSEQHGQQRMVQRAIPPRAIPPVINGYLATLTTSSSITGVQHGQQRMVQRAIPPVINGYLATLTSHPSLANSTDNTDGSACDPSRYKWLPRHTHYLSSIMRQHGQRMVQRAIPPL